MDITIICSDKQHKIFPYLECWVEENSKVHNVSLVTKPEDVTKGNILFLISCTKIIKSDLRERFKQTLVIHESDLPKGRGWSPLVWQIINGSNTIPISLIDAAEKVDSGDIWKKEFVILEGHEVADEINDKVFPVKIKLMDFAIKNMDSIRKIPQKGEPTYFTRRKPEDSELDVTKTIGDQFDLMRVADNKRYPSFFNFRGHRYKIIIDKIK